MRYFVNILTGICLATLSAVLSVRATAQEELMIIANLNVPIDQLSETDVNRIFLLKRTAWENGNPIIPVNREASSEIRVQFSKDILGASLRSLSKYWNQMQFKGHMPPVVQESNAAMVAFVTNVPGSIGYIKGSKVPPNVKILAKIK